MEEDVEHVEQTKSLMDKDVFVMRDISVYLDNVELVILLQLIKMVIVFVIMDIMEIEIFVKNVTILVEHVVDQELINVLHVLTFLMFLIVDFVLDQFVIQELFYKMEYVKNVLTFAIIVLISFLVMNVLKVLI